MKQYVYPAVFTPEEGGRFSVCFPDLDGCYTCGDDLSDAVTMAEDVLAYCLYDEKSAGNPLPKSSEAQSITLEEGEFIKYITCNTLWYESMHDKDCKRKAEAGQDVVMAGRKAALHG
ncbi:MAG: type II toxin-antitoxin system HicB family antitoxin [Lachnospiraceae bacterium]|nr:type II toxin-antitoxin system HicB family antitoxin [Lachnospiraceae bacterium]